MRRCRLIWSPCLVPSTTSAFFSRVERNLFVGFLVMKVVWHFLLFFFGSWVLGEWTPCTVTCGDGIQTRDLTCKQEISATLTMRVNEAACLGAAPSVPRVRNCNLGHCAKWHTSDWGKVRRNENLHVSISNCIIVRETCLLSWLITGQHVNWMLLPCRHLTSLFAFFFLWSARRVAAKEWGTGASIAKDLTDVMSANPIARLPKGLRAAIFAIWAPVRPTPGSLQSGLVKYVVLIIIYFFFFLLFSRETPAISQLRKNLCIFNLNYCFVGRFAVLRRMRHWHSNAQSSLFQQQWNGLRC